MRGLRDMYMASDGIDRHQNKGFAIMNQAQDNEIASGSVDTFAQEVNKILFRDARSPEENKQRKAELEFAVQKSRIIARERRYEELKEAVRRKLRGELDYE